jgi:hypothetical protein
VRIYDGYYEMDDSIGPELIISTVEGDWMIDNLPNYNLKGLEANPTTGDLEWEIRVGADEPGEPRWFKRTSINEEHAGADSPHFGATMRADDSIPFNLAAPLMPSWPYLSAVDREGHWGRIQPIYFSHRMRTIEQNWTGFHIAGMYQINSITPPPNTNFESPFAFYRFDQTADYHANMVIRSDIWPAHDRHGPPPTHQQRTAMRMTWTDENDELWRYSLTVGGGHAHDQEVQIGDTTVIAISYEDLPGWITSRPWSAVTFVEATNGETGSEGIYDFSVEDNYPVTEWISGLRMQPPTEEERQTELEVSPTLEILEHEPWADFREPYLEFPAIHPLRLETGFRGEYSLNYDRNPKMYFSPIDNRIHLLYAHEGIWNLGDGRVLRVKNSNSDPYIDTWWIERVPKSDSEIIEGVSVAASGRVEQQFFDLGGYLLYTSDSRVEFRELDTIPENRRLDVPVDELSWRAFLHQASGEDKEERDPLALEGWIGEFDGNSIQLYRAKAADVRRTESGFRFVLDLQRSFRADGQDFANLGELSPGRYLVEYDGAFSIVPLTPPLISSTISEISPVALQSVPFTVSLENKGLKDLNQVTFDLIASPERGEEVSVLTAKIDVYGESSLIQTLHWAPPFEGEWTLTPVISTTGNQTIELETESFMVAPPEKSGASELIKDSIASRARLASLAGLLAFAVVAGLVWWSQVFPSRPGGTKYDR